MPSDDNFNNRVCVEQEPWERAFLPTCERDAGKGGPGGTLPKVPDNKKAQPDWDLCF